MAQRAGEAMAREAAATAAEAVVRGAAVEARATVVVAKASAVEVMVKVAWLEEMVAAAIPPPKEPRGSPRVGVRPPPSRRLY